MGSERVRIAGGYRHDQHVGLERPGLVGMQDRRRTGRVASQSRPRRPRRRQGRERSRIMRHNHGAEEGPGLACREALTGECIRTEWRVLRACIEAEIDLALHQATCRACAAGEDCAAGDRLLGVAMQRRDVAWESVRPGVTRLRVDAFTGMLVTEQSDVATQGSGREA